MSGGNRTYIDSFTRLELEAIRPQPGDRGSDRGSHVEDEEILAEERRRGSRRVGDRGGFVTARRLTEVVLVGVGPWR